MWFNKKYIEQIEALKKDNKDLYQQVERLNIHKIRLEQDLFRLKEANKKLSDKIKSEEQFEVRIGEDWNTGEFYSMVLASGFKPETY